LANGMTIDELNKEKSKTIDKAANVRQIWLNFVTHVVKDLNL
jgi:hypothetical protein